MARQKIRELAADIYEDAELAAAVCADAEKNHNTEKIEAGELVLPHPHDARTWYNRVTGKTPVPGVGQPAEAIINDLMARLATLEGKDKGKK